MYAASAISLSLLWGALNVLNMAHGALLTAGGYIAFTLITLAGIPVWLGLIGTIGAGALIGAALFYGVIRWMRDRPNFEVNVIIATVGLALIAENIVLRQFGAYPLQQNVGLSGGFRIAASYVPWTNLAILVSSIALMLAVSWYLERTRAGRAIRATSQDRVAAQLMGVPVSKVFVNVLILSGMLAAASGVMLSLITTLSPTMGYDPMLKAFIVCVIAGLGNVRGALYAAFILGIFEATIQFVFGVRFGFPALLGIVIVALIWRPYGVFGTAKVARL